MTALPPDGFVPGCKGLVFDADGTLLDTMPHHWKAWDYMCKKYGVELTVERFQALAGKPAHEILALIAKEQGKEIDIDKAIHDKHTYYTNELMPKLTRIESVVAIAKYAREQGIKCAVASGGTRSHVIEGLKSTGIFDLFDAIACSEDTPPGRGKPHPDVFLIAARGINADPATCVGYEDAQLGLQAICTAGFLAAVNVCKLDGYPPFERHDED